jgi:hypothetical protein
VLSPPARIPHLPPARCAGLTAALRAPLPLQRWVTGPLSARSLPSNGTRLAGKAEAGASGARRDDQNQRTAPRVCAEAALASDVERGVGRTVPPLGGRLLPASFPLSSSSFSLPLFLLSPCQVYYKVIHYFSKFKFNCVCSIFICQIRYLALIPSLPIYLVGSLPVVGRGLLSIACGSFFRLGA